LIYIAINGLPIALATIAGLVIGLIWLRASKILLPDWRLLALAGVAEFWIAAILAGALILAPPQAGEWTMALGSAFVIWIGFVMPSIVVTLLVHRFEKGAVVSAALHWLIVMLVQSTILKAWGLTPPPGA